MKWIAPPPTFEFIFPIAVLFMKLQFSTVLVSVNLIAPPNAAELFVKLQSPTAPLDDVYIAPPLCKRAVLFKKLQY